MQTFHDNPRRGNIDVIAKSLETRGQYRPIVVNIGKKTGRAYEILAGNHTFLAAKKLGWKQIEAVTVDVDEAGAAAIVVADNRIADLGTYNDETLQALLDVIDDPETVGYSLEDLSGLEDLAAADLDALAEEYGELQDDDMLGRISFLAPRDLVSVWNRRVKDDGGDPAATLRSLLAL
nr:ParB N-terminal domain-containing protein [Mobiluncus mulieris]